MLKWLYWIPFIIVAISFHIYFLEFFSSDTVILNGAREQNPSSIYFKYLTYFFLLGALFAQALFKTTNYTKIYTILLAVTVVSAPLLTFRNLVVAPFDYTELINIFYEIVLICFGLYILYFLHLMSKRVFNISFKDEDWTALFIIASLVFSWVFYLDNVPIRGDTLKLMATVTNPSANTLDYWLHMFTNPIHGPQYRPLSFFAIFYLFQHLFGPAVWPFQCLGIILATLSGKLFFNLLKETSRSYFVALVGSCYLICHFSTVSMLIYPSLVEKYLFPLAFLIFGLLIVKQGLHRKLSYSVTLVLLSVISIMSHEGSFVFPIVFVLFDFAIYKTLRKQHLLFILPSAVYFFVRLFYFKVPNKRFMKVDLWNSIEYLPKYLDSVLVPSRYLDFISTIPWMPNLSICFFAVILFVYIYVAIRQNTLGLSGGIYFTSKKHYLTIGVLFFSAIIILFPFSVLANHFHLNRSMWAIVPIVLLISFIVGNIQKRKIKLLFCGIFLLWLFIHGYSNILKVKGEKKAFILETEIQKHLETSIAKQLKQGSPAVIYINPAEIQRGYPKLFAAFLSIKFPKETFIIKIRKKSHKFTTRFFVKNGTFFKRRNDQWLDEFSYKSQVELPEKTMIIYINPKMLEILIY